MSRRSYSECCHYDEGYDDGYKDAGVPDAALFAAERLGAIRRFLGGSFDVLAELDDVIDSLERAVGLACYATQSGKRAA